MTVARSAEPIVATAPAPASPPVPTASTDSVLARMPVVPATPSGQSYDQINAQLRRDLLRQRERIGDILGDLPWV